VSDVNPGITTKLDSSLIRHYEDVVHSDNGRYRHFSAGGSTSKLLFFGSLHLRDIGEPMFSEIRALADKAKPDLIFVEGLQGLRRTAPASKRAEWLRDICSTPVAQAVSRFGERGFVVKYAQERNIAVECPEPDLREEIQHIMQQGFSREAVVAYYVYRMVHQWLHSSGPSSIEAYLAPTITELKVLCGWSDFDWSFENIASLSETFWKAPLKLVDKRFYLKGISPFTTRTHKAATETNHVSAASSFFRDKTIAEEVVSARARARSIFVVFGSGHSFTLEDALTAAFASGLT